MLLRSRNNFWNMCNGSWWAENGGIASYWNTEVPLDTLAGLIFNRLREMEIQQKIDGKQRAELTYNLFQMLIELKVLPDDWLLQIETLGVLPFELLGVYSVLNFTQILRNAAELQKKTKMKVNGTLLFQINGMDLFDFAHTGNIIQYALLPSDITAAYHLLTFIDPYEYSTEDGTFAIYH